MSAHNKFTLYVLPMFLLAGCFSGNIIHNQHNSQEVSAFTKRSKYMTNLEAYKYCPPGGAVDKSSYPVVFQGKVTNVLTASFRWRWPTCGLHSSNDSHVV